MKKDCLEKLQKKCYYKKEDLVLEAMSFMAGNFEDAVKKFPARSSLEIQVTSLSSTSSFSYPGIPFIVLY